MDFKEQLMWELPVAQLKLKGFVFRSRIHPLEEDAGFALGFFFGLIHPPEHRIPPVLGTGICWV